MKLLYVSLFLLSFTLLAANKDSLNNLNEKLDNQRAKVFKIAAEIKHLEKKLGQTNNTYLEKVNLIEKLEQKIKMFQTELELSAKEISDDYMNSKKALNLYLLEVSDAENDDQILHKKIYYELLRDKLLKFQKAQSKSNELLEMINLYEQKLSQTKASEEEIYNLIVDLENRKKEMSQTYINQLEQKNELEVTVDKAKAKTKAYKKVYAKKVQSKANEDIIPMLLPIENFISVDKSKKGLMLKYSKMSPVLAPSAGKVAYTGELASYGNVILIDHGNEVRSVIFGDMKIKAQKGDVVQEAEVLAYTLADPGVNKSLYYEIRKKNVVQNTLEWISNKNKQNIKI